MKKLVLFVLIVLFALANSFAGDGKEYGKKIELIEKTSVSSILEDPESLVGKKVLIEGIILDVCSHRGCWIEIASDKEFQKIRVKVEDGEIVFPMEEKGKTALVEGIVEKLIVKKDGHEGCGSTTCSGEEKKEEGCLAKNKEETVAIYQIKGLGAVIK